MRSSSRSGRCGASEIAAACAGAAVPGFDQGDGRRRWRALDLGDDAGVRGGRRAAGDAVAVTASWSARCRGRVIGSRFTRAFEDQAAWLAVNTSKTAVAELMRVAWRTVGAICERVATRRSARSICSTACGGSGSTRSSHRKGQRYLTVVVDHDTGRLVWAAAGRDRKTVERFLDELGEERCKQIELVSCDMAGWIAAPVADRLPDAVRCVDPFHVVMLATDALDEVRREVWNEARKAGELAAAKDLKGARFALWKNPENLTDRQAAKLSSIQKTNARLYRAYLLKEQLQSDLPAARRRGGQAARRMDRVGAALSPRIVRQARPHDHHAARRDRRGDRARPVQRPRRSDQHPDPDDHPPRLRLSQRRRADRAGDAVARRALPATATLKPAGRRATGASSCAWPGRQETPLRGSLTLGPAGLLLTAQPRFADGGDQSCAARNRARTRSPSRALTRIR